MLKPITLLLMLVLLALPACCASVESRPVDPCQTYTECTDDPSAVITCDGEGLCACITSHPGENRAASCNYGKASSASRGE